MYPWEGRDFTSLEITFQREDARVLAASSRARVKLSSHSVHPRQPPAPAPGPLPQGGAEGPAREQAEGDAVETGSRPQPAPPTWTPPPGTGLTRFQAEMVAISHLVTPEVPELSVPGMGTTPAGLDRRSFQDHFRSHFPTNSIRFAVEV